VCRFSSLSKLILSPPTPSLISQTVSRFAHIHRTTCASTWESCRLHACMLSGYNRDRTTTEPGKFPGVAHLRVFCRLASGRLPLAFVPSALWGVSSASEAERRRRDLGGGGEGAGEEEERLSGAAAGRAGFGSDLGRAL
jgi:hypothetical protein